MPSTPYIIKGVVSDQDSSLLSDVRVVAHDVTTGEKTDAHTNTLGQYIIDISNLTNGYTIGDSFNVYVWDKGYTGETTSFTLSGENVVKNISTCNQVTLATIRNTIWYAFYSTLQDGTYEVSEDSIFSAMNDTIISDEGYPIIIIYTPSISKNGVNLTNAQLNCDVNFMIEIYHTSSENVKILADEVEDKIWNAQLVWDGLGLSNLTMPNSDHDWWTEGKKKIHRITLNANFKFDGVL